MTTLGTKHLLVLGRPGLVVGVGMLLDQPGGQVASQLAGAGLALIEGDQIGLVIGVEHQVKGGGGLGEPAAAQVLARVRKRRWVCRS